MSSVLTECWFTVYSAGHKPGPPQAACSHSKLTLMTAAGLLTPNTVHTHSSPSYDTHTHLMQASVLMTGHSPHGAVRPSAYLFESCVFLRDFPHRAVDFLTVEIWPSLHDEEERTEI